MSVKLKAKDLYARKGDGVDATFTLTDVSDGSAVSPTDPIFEIYDDEYLLLSVTESGIANVTLGVSANVVTLSCSAGWLSSIESGSYTWRLRAEIDGTYNTIFAGDFIVLGPSEDRAFSDQALAGDINLSSFNFDINISLGGGSAGLNAGIEIDVGTGVSVPEIKFLSGYPKDFDDVKITAGSASTWTGNIPEWEPEYEANVEFVAVDLAFGGFYRVVIDIDTNGDVLVATSDDQGSASSPFRVNVYQVMAVYEEAQDD